MLTKISLLVKIVLFLFLDGLFHSYLVELMQHLKLKLENYVMETTSKRQRPESYVRDTTSGKLLRQTSSENYFLKTESRRPYYGDCIRKTILGIQFPGDQVQETTTKQTTSWRPHQADNVRKTTYTSLSLADDNWEAMSARLQQREIIRKTTPGRPQQADTLGRLQTEDDILGNISGKLSLGDYVLATAPGRQRLRDYDLDTSHKKLHPGDCLW